MRIHLELSHSWWSLFVSPQFFVFYFSFYAYLTFYFCSSNPANSSIIMKYSGHDRTLHNRCINGYAIIGACLIVYLLRGLLHPSLVSFHSVMQGMLTRCKSKDYAAFSFWTRGRNRKAGLSCFTQCSGQFPTSSISCHVSFQFQHQTDERHVLISRTSERESRFHSNLERFVQL